MGDGPRHLLIYGPPAAGKLTVATAFAARFGYRVVDNHASIDPALYLFSFGMPEFETLVEQIRVALISAAARARLNIVTTLVYDHGVDYSHVERLTAATVEHGGTVAFVQLRPPDHALEQRVTGESRKTSKKITDLRRLRSLLARYDLDTPIHATDLRIDNSEISPQEVTEIIGRHLGLLT